MGVDGLTIVADGNTALWVEKMGQVRKKISWYGLEQILLKTISPSQFLTWLINKPSVSKDQGQCQATWCNCI